MAEYQVTYKVKLLVYQGWMQPERVIEEDLELELEFDNGVGDCCAVGSIGRFFDDGDFARHPADHHYVTVKAVEAGCRKLVKEYGCSIAYATINTEQASTEAALLECGFVCTTDGWCYRNPKYSKYKTGVKVFIKPLHKVLKRIKKV